VTQAVCTPSLTPHPSQPNLLGFRQRRDLNSGPQACWAGLFGFSYFLNRVSGFCPGWITAQASHVPHGAAGVTVASFSLSVWPASTWDPPLCASEVAGIAGVSPRPGPDLLLKEPRGIQARERPEGRGRLHLSSGSGPGFITAALRRTF
jgi:hypothetical protein